MVVLNKIYTKSGDAGETALGNGDRVAKHSQRVNAYGTVDETNATVGLARLHASGEIDAQLAMIQNDLFDLGADLATPTLEDESMALRVVQSLIDRVEQDLDALNADLEPLNSFVLPGGSPPAAALHMARTIVRRAETTAVEAAKTEDLNPLAITYLNRASDFLFVAARWCNTQGQDDVKWVPGANR